MTPQLHKCKNPDCDMNDVPTGEIARDQRNIPSCVHCGDPVAELRGLPLEAFKVLARFTSRDHIAYRLGVLDFVIEAISNGSITAPSELIVKALTDERDLRVKQLAVDEAEVTDADLKAGEDALAVDALFHILRGTDA